MPTFDTPEPISVIVELGVGDVRVVAADRSDTVVEIRPSDPNKNRDVAAAEQTRVELANGRLRITATKGWRQWSLFGAGSESVEVLVDVPAGSNVSVQAGVASLHGLGRLGECRFRTGVGHVHLEQAGPVAAKTGAGDVTVDRAGQVALGTGAGDVTVDRAEGSLDVTTGSGAVRLTRVDGAAVVKNSNGDTWIGSVAGDVRVNAANGRISIDVAGGAVSAKSARGDVRVGEVARGTVVAQSAFGEVEVGIREGVAAWLDLETGFGHVRSDLDRSEQPDPGEEAVEIHARSSYGDITIHRSEGSGTRRDDA